MFNEWRKCNRSFDFRLLLCHQSARLIDRQLRSVTTVAFCGFTAFNISAQATVRVALMDFSTDDNAYRAVVAARDLTTALYGQLPRDEVGVASRRGGEEPRRGAARGSSAPPAPSRCSPLGGPRRKESRSTLAPARPPRSQTRRSARVRGRAAGPRSSSGG